MYLTDIERREKEKEALKDEVKASEDRANSYFQKFAKMQEDHSNLIGIAAELVDSLEKCVRGNMVRITSIKNLFTNDLGHFLLYGLQ